MSQSEVEKVIERDEKEDDDFGQNVRDAYPKADFFVNLGIPSGEWAVGKFVDLLFGNPWRTPSSRRICHVSCKRGIASLPRQESSGRRNYR